MYQHELTTEVAVARTHLLPVTIARRWSPARSIGFAAAAIGAGLALGTLGVGVLTVLAARKVITPPSRPLIQTRIVEVGDGWITLTATPETRLGGKYGLWFDDDRGHLKMGDVIERTSGWVRREVIAIDFGEPKLGMGARTGAAFFLSPRELDVPTRDVEIMTELGPAPAWLVSAGDPGHEGAWRSATGDRWAILVHGRAAQRHEAIRAIPSFRKRGWTTLTVSYRNDPGAPASPDGRYALGDREWADVEAAIRYARRRGAKRIVLMGWSMGGALSLQTITRSAIAKEVESVMLDSPVVDWVSTLRLQTKVNHLPMMVLPAVVGVLSSAWGRWITGQSGPIDLQRLDLVRSAALLRIPILILHSVDDGYVPISASRALALARPELVQLVEFVGAHHVRLWNLAPERWERSIDTWLMALDAAHAQTTQAKASQAKTAQAKTDQS